MLLSSASALAQTYSFQQYGHDEGLTNTDIESVIQDRTGYLWVGTTNGLFRYDGADFRHYGEADGLSPRIETLHVTEDGTLWVGTLHGLYRQRAERFEEVRLPDKSSARRGGIRSDSRSRIFVSSRTGLQMGTPAPNGEILFTTVVHGEQIRGIDWDRTADAVWFACGDQLCRWKAGALNRFGVESGVPVASWSAVRVDSSGQVWARSRDRLIRRGSGAFERIQVPWAVNEGELFLDATGRLFVPTVDGIAFEADGAWRLTGSGQGLPSAAVACAFLDREGSLWLGLAGAGLVRWRGFDRWTSWLPSKDSSNDVTRAILRSRSGRIWAGTGKGLYFSDPPYRTVQPSSAYPLQDVTALAEDPQGGLWIGSSHGQLVVLDVGSGRSSRFGPESGLPEAPLTSIVLDQGQRPWITTGRGLFRGSPNSTGSLQFEKLVEGRRATHRGMFDAAGRYWATGNKGLFRMDPDGSVLTIGAQDGLSRDPVTALLVTRDGAVYVGYRDVSGYARVTFPGGKIQVERLALPDAGSHAKVTGFAADRAGRLWIASDDGIWALTGPEGWRHYTREDGLGWNSCTRNTLFADPDGSLWVGTARGFSRFDSRRPDVAAPPAVVLNSVVLGDVEVKPNETPSAGHTSNRLIVSYGALTYSDAKNVRFRYRLAASDLWRETPLRTLQFPRLSPGRYTFEVQARGRGGLWSRDSASFTFEVRPAWWQSPVFWLVVASGAVVLLIGIWRMRERRYRRDIELRERTRRQLEAAKNAAEEASAAKGAFLANMSHELRTPLNAIIGYTEILQEDAHAAGNAGASADLARIHGASRHLLDLIQDVLDLSRIEARRMTVQLETIPVRQLLDEAREMAEPLALANRNRLEVNYSGNDDHIVADRVRFRQSLYNLLSNACKFTEDGVVTLEVRPHGTECLWSVKDTGIGIAPEHQHKLFQAFSQVDSSATRLHDGTGLGLAISQRLCQMMGGEIGVVSEAGQGSTFTIRIPAAPAGTSERAQPRPPISSD